MKNLTILIFSILSMTSNGQNWQWANHLGGTGQFNCERANSVISDGTNFYAIGSYGDDLFLPNDTLYSNGLNDIFIAKFDASGNQIWAKLWVATIYNLMQTRMPGEYMIQ